MASSNTQHERKKLKIEKKFFNNLRCCLNEPKKNQSEMKGEYLQD